jgi:hypothetical protein
MWEIVLNLLGVLFIIYYAVTFAFIYHTEENSPFWAALVGPVLLPFFLIYEFKRRIAEVAIAYAVIALGIVVFFKVVIWLAGIFR